MDLLVYIIGDGLMQQCAVPICSLQDGTEDVEKSIFTALNVDLNKNSTPNYKSVEGMGWNESDIGNRMHRDSGGYGQYEEATDNNYSNSTNKQRDQT